MVIGSVLLQPQRLQRASQRAAEDALLDDLISLGVYLLLDGLDNGDIARTMGESLGGTVQRLSTQAGAGVNSAVTRFGTLLHPLIAPIQALGTPPDNPLDAITSAEHSLEFVVNLLKGLSAPAIRQHMTEVFDILATDLGITPTFVGDLVAGLLGDLVTALQVAPPSETEEQRARRRAVADLLGRIKRYLAQHFTFPTLNADAAAQALINLIITPDMADALGRISCTSDALGAYFHVGDTLIKAIPYSASESFGAGGMGAAAAPDARTEISFYGSKLLEFDNIKSDLGKLPPNTSFNDGMINQALCDAFRPLSIVLANTAFVYTVEDGNEWRVVDRKKYVLAHVASTVAVYRYFEIDESELYKGDQEHQNRLLKIFRENGFPLTGDVTEVHQVDGQSNAWAITIGSTSFNVLKEDGTVTVRPPTTMGALFELSGDLQPADDAKIPTDALRAAFASHSVPLTARCKLSVRNPGTDWVLDDGEFEYKVNRDKQDLNVSIGNILGWVRSKVKKPKGDVVWVNKERTQVALGQRIMFIGTDVAWQNAPIFSSSNTGNRRYSFKAEPATTEKWAYYVSWIQDALHVLVDATQIGIAAHKGEAKYKATSASLDGLRLTSEVIAKLALRRPISEAVGSPFWYDLILDGLLMIPKIIEGVTKPSDPSPGGLNKFSSFVDTVLGAALSVDPVDTNWTEAACEFVMSLVTLINHIEPQPGQERPENFKESSGFVDPFWMAGMLIYTASIPITNVSQYAKAFPFEDAAFTLGNWLAASIGVGVVTSFLGYVIAQGIAGMNPFAELSEFGTTVGVACLKSVGYFWPFLKLVHKADIDRILPPPP